MYVRMYVCTYVRMYDVVRTHIRTYVPSLLENWFSKLFLVNQTTPSWFSAKAEPAAPMDPWSTDMVRQGASTKPSGSTRLSLPDASTMKAVLVAPPPESRTTRCSPGSTAFKQQRCWRAEAVSSRQKSSYFLPKLTRIVPRAYAQEWNCDWMRSLKRFLFSSQF